MNGHNGRNMTAIELFTLLTNLFLQFFVKIFNSSMDKAETNPAVLVRVAEMIRVITEDVYVQVKFDG
jgi:hypothetical protein